MPTTTNYGWTTPADTDLVKDGASAIRTLGTAIDTTVFNNASAAIAKTIVDAKGDIIAATAADTVSRLAVGTNGQYLAANSSTATGLEWQTVSAGGMTLLSNTTLSGTTVTVSSISADYTDLYLFFAGLSMTGGAGQTKIQAYFNNDSGIIDFTGTHRTATTNALSGVQNSFIQFNYSDFQGGNANNAFVIRINNYAQTSYYKTFQANWGGTEVSDTNVTGNFGGIIKTNSAISTFNLINADARTFSGNLKIYGVK